MFKNYVKKRVINKFIQKLKCLKDKHSKSNYLDCSELKVADYLKDPRLDTKKKQLLFKLRSRTLEVKANFGTRFENPWCISCGQVRETQGHLLQCPPLVKNLKYLSEKDSKLNENDIYGSLDKQIQIVNIYSDILEQREIVKNQKNIEDFPQIEGPMHPTHRVLQHTSSM